MKENEGNEKQIRTKRNVERKTWKSEIFKSSNSKTESIARIYRKRNIERSRYERNQKSPTETKTTERNVRLKFDTKFPRNKNCKIHIFSSTKRKTKNIELRKPKETANPIAENVRN